MLASVTNSASVMLTANNMRKLGLAIYKYEAENQHLPPPALCGPAGEPLLSWRVLVLPYLGEDEKRLYDEFRLDEPWDSPHNLRLLPRMPKLFVHPRKGGRQTWGTYFQLIVGKGAAFEMGQWHTLHDIDKADGLSSTIFMVEAANPVPWTKPEDLTFDVDGPPPLLGKSPGPRGFETLMLFGDCSVRGVLEHPYDPAQGYVSPDVAQAELRKAMTWRGGEVLGNVIP
jgi:hypothetical protein